MNASLLLVIDHSDAQVTLDGRALRVQRPDQPPQHVPLGLVVVQGKALVACDVWWALVLDLIEPLRPSVAVVILGFLDQLLAPEDFTHGEHEGCLLAQAARGRFYQAWARARQDWPDLHAAVPAAADGLAPPVTTLAQLCRRQTERLRADLRSLMPALGHREGCQLDGSPGAGDGPA